MAINAAVLSGFAIALLAPWIHRVTRSASGWLLALAPLSMLAVFASYLPQVVEGETILVSYSWIPSLGIELSYRLDGLSLLFALIITGVGTLIMIYTGGYSAGHPSQGRLYGLLLFFMASMLGVVLADNLVLVYVFWELTGVSSYLLIGFDHNKPEARAAALQAFMVTTGCGLAMLAGMVLLGGVAGSYDFGTLFEQGSAIRGHDLYLPIMILILLGAGSKSAQFPFHFWLPNAMAAPTPVSAYLHSATMVKAGIYLLARLNPVLGGTDYWTVSVSVIGGTTMVLGALLTAQQHDLKRLLAFSTVSALGLLVLTIGLGTEISISGLIVFLVSHACYKGALFLVVGALDHETGTRDIRSLSGLRSAMPLTTLAAGLAAVSMAGLPPTITFIGKEYVYEAATHGPIVALLVGATMVATTVFVAAALIVGVRPFIGALASTPKTPHEGPLSLWLGPLVLSIIGLTLGAWPALEESLLRMAVSQVFGEQVELKLALWHGVNLAVGLSVLTLVLGVLLFSIRARWVRWTEKWEFLGRLGPAQWYEWSLAGLMRFAREQTRLLQSGYLRFYLTWILATAIVLVGYALVSHGSLIGHPLDGSIDLFEVLLTVLLVLAAGICAVTQYRFVAITSLGVVGYAIAILFVIYGAPDLAMTQFLIETLMVILFVLVFYRLPPFVRLSSRSDYLRDAVVSGCFGIVMSMMLWNAISVEPDAHISEYFMRESVPKAQGHNVVNVILVDFRAFDTLGELTVLALAGIGVFALLRLRVRSEDTSDS